jgi:hypothetical protein
MLTIARNIPDIPKGENFPLLKITAWLTKPNPGKIRM